MTNNLGIPIVPCCPPNSDGGLWPLLLVVVVLMAGHIAIQELKKRKGKPEMKNLKNISIVAALVVAAGIVFALKHNPVQPPNSIRPDAAETASASPGTTAPAQSAALPRLVDLGATKCMQCKMMAPILEDLKSTYAGQMQVDFIDVWDHPEAGEQYGIRMIPTQILYDAQGKELFRHEGFFPKEDILAKWRELGVEFAPAAPQAP